jgi:hypothetical protein
MTQRLTKFIAELTFDPLQKAFETDPDLRDLYKNKITCCIFDNSPLSLDDCNKVAEEIIETVLVGKFVEQEET